MRVIAVADLGVGDVVDRGDHTPFDANAGVDDLDDGSKAVCCARRGRDDVVYRRVIEVVVASHDDVQNAIVLDGSRDDDLAHAAVEVGLQQLGCAELPGGFEDDVDAVVRPRNSARC
jgi:hypothetical protein